MYIVADPLKISNWDKSVDIILVYSRAPERTTSKPNNRLSAPRRLDRPKKENK